MNKQIWDTVKDNFKNEDWAYVDPIFKDEWYFNDNTPVNHLIDQIASIVEDLSNDVDTKRAHYFAMRDMLWSNGGTGYSKLELHALAKKDIFPLMVEETDNFIEGGKAQKEFSVTWLSEKGWETFNEQFKLWAAENFNFYL